MNYGHGYPAKYRNKKTNGFDSKREYERYQELKLMERVGLIHGLKRQVHFELTPQVREPDTYGPKGGRRKGKVILERSEYIADFTYTTQNGEFIVEDVKGYRTAEYILKKKFLYAKKGILIHET